MNPALTFLTSLMLPLVALHAAEAPKSQAKPNIIVILADDLGYECIGANGGKSYRTPHLDRLAREGVRFEHCYAQPNCTPTRAQLMTGMSNVRNYVGFGELEKSQTTFGHIFSRAGYATCIAGKWQLGSKDPGLPKHFGFDEHCLWAHMGRGERYANPSLSMHGELKTFEGKYGPDVCQEFVFDFIRRHRSKTFFVYYPMLLTHGGYEATPDSVDWGKSTAKSRELGQQHFADMVTYMDKQIGALTRELETLGLISNTLILFTGDNGTGRGAVSEIEGGGEMAGEKGSTTRGDITLRDGATSSEAIAWSNPKIAPYNPTPLVFGDELYILYDQGMLSCYDAKTGQPHYEKVRLSPAGGGVAGGFTASPWAHDGKIFCLSERAETFVVKAGPQFELLCRNALEPEPCLACPALVGDRIILRTASRLYSIRDSSAKPR